MRIQNSNPKYVYATIVEEADEVKMCGKASQNYEWRKAGIRDHCAEAKSSFGASAKAKRCETYILQISIQDIASSCCLVEKYKARLVA